MTIAVPARNVTSLCFVGSDLRAVYIVTCDTPTEPKLRGCVYRTRFGVPGLSTPMARV